MSKKLFSANIGFMLLLGIFFFPTSFLFAGHPCDGDGPIEGHDCIQNSYNNEVSRSENRREYVNQGGSPVSYDSSEDGGEITTFGGLLNTVNGILNAIIPFLIGLAVFLIIYGVFGYISHSADEEKRAEARQFIIWGVIFVFVMISIWGLINILGNTIKLDKTAPSVRPIFPTSS